MNKDQVIGAAVLLVCLVIAIGYLVTLFYPNWIVNIGLVSSTVDIQFWIIATPVFVGFTAILFIGAWIGWTMATTPPLKPIEEITNEPAETKTA